MRASACTLVLVALATGCAGSMTGRRGTDGFDTRPAEVQGVLVEVRHYLETGAVGDDHTFCASQSVGGDQPVGVLTEDGRLVVLTSRPSRIAGHVARMVRITGKLTANGQLLVPSSLRVRTGTTWTAAEL